MDVLYALHMLFQLLYRVFAAIGKVTGIKQQTEIRGIGVFHHAVGFFRRLHDGAHVMMQREVDAVFFF